MGVVRLMSAKKEREDARVLVLNGGGGCAVKTFVMELFLFVPG